MEFLIPLSFGVTSALLVFVRRFKNPNDHLAGYAISGWGLIGTFILSAIALSL